MGTERQFIRLPAEVPSLRLATAFLRGGAASAGFPEARLLELDLVIEELFVNVALYSGAGDVEISYTLTDAGCLDVEIADEGIAFDPMSAEAPDLEAPSHGGGLGIFLALSLAPTLTYRRAGERNVVRFQFCAS